MLAYLFNSPDKRIIHIMASETFSAVEAERVFVQVHLQILRADIVIDASNAILCQRPEAFNRVRVRIARDIDALPVMYPLVLITGPFEWIVGDVFIREDDALGQHSLRNMRNERCGLGIRNHFGHDFTAAFNETEYRRFPSAASSQVLPFAPMLVLFQTAIKAFVRLNLASQWTIAFIEHRANPVEDTPCAFIGDAKLAVQLLRADSASRDRHQMDRIEPELERRCRVLKDRAAHRVFVMTAILAGVGWPIGLAVMLGYLLAFRAMDAVWIESINQPFEARRIIGKFPLKFHQRVSAVRNARPDWVITINLAHTANHGIRAYFRQGYTYPNLVSEPSIWLYPDLPLLFISLWWRCFWGGACW
jgi:hypothetical protein